MASLVTGIIGGIQSRNAAKNAAAAQEQAADLARGDVDAATIATIAEILGVSEAEAAAVIQAGGDAAAGVEGAAERANTLLDPFRTAGTNAVSTLSEQAAQGPVTLTAEELMADPSYQFRQSEAMKQIERSMAAQGQGSGAAAWQAMQGRASDLASQEFQSAWERKIASTGQNQALLQGLAGMGADAAALAGRNTTTAATTAGGFRTDGVRTGAAIRTSGVNAAGNTRMRGALTSADIRLDRGNATAAGHIGAGNAWNGMLSTIGQTGDAALAGGFGGSGGFSWRGAVRGARR
jgi:hypothetical protein